MLEISCLHTNTYTETSAPLISCVINDALLKIMPDIDQALLQFADVMNLVGLLLHFCPYFVVNLVQICGVGWPGVVCCSKKLTASHARRAAAEAFHCWKIKNTAQISRIADSSFWVRSMSQHWSSLQHRRTSGQFAPTWTHPWILSVTCWRLNVSAADTLVQHVSFLLQPAHRCHHSQDFWM